MGEKENVAVVMQLYEDFGQGNIPGVLMAMTEDVSWKQPEAGPAPFAGTIRGREQLGLWFSQMDAVSEVEAFEPKEFIADANKVVVLGNYVYRAKATGKRWESDWVMVWDVKNGQIAAGQIFEDTLAQSLALASD